MSTTSPTRLNGAQLSRLGTAHIDPGSYVAFKVDPYASLAVLGDPITNFYTKDLLEPKHSKVYLGVVLEAHRLVGCGRYQLTLSVLGPKPATVSQDDANTLVPIFSSTYAFLARSPVLPIPPLLPRDVYHYPKVIRVKVSATVLPEDCSSFTRGFPKLRTIDLERLKTYAEHDARRINRPDPGAPQGDQVLQDLKPMDMAAEIARVKTAIRRAPLGAFDPETPSERRDRLWLFDRETDPTLPGGILHWEPVVTVWMNPNEAGDSLTLPKMLDTELALLKRIADIFNRRWIEWVREVYVHRSTKPVVFPPIYDRQGHEPGRTVVMIKDSVAPSGLATRDVTTEPQREGNQDDEKPVAAEVIIPLEVAPVPAPVPAKPHKSNRPDRRAGRLRDAQAAINRFTTAAKFVGKGACLAAIGSYYAAKFSFKAVRYAVDGYLTLTGRPSRVRGRPRPIKARMYQVQSNPQQGN